MVEPSEQTNPFARQVERPRRRLGPLAGTRGAEALHRREAGKQQRVQAGLDATGDDRVGAAASQQLGRLSDRVGAGRAGGARARSSGPAGRASCAIAPLAVSTSVAGKKCGATRAQPRSRMMSCCSRIVMNPPIAEPTSTPIRSRSKPERSASSTASRAAVIASRTLRSSRRASLGDATTDGSKSGTSPTTVIGRSPGSKCVGSAMPERPSQNRVPGHVGADPDRRHDPDSGDGDAHATNLVDRPRGLADALPCARRTRATVPGRSASTDCRGDHGLHPGRTGARGGSPLPAPRRDIARNDHRGARPGSRRADPQLHRIPREGGLLRRPELPPRRARLRAAGRLSRREPAPATRATRSSAPRRATTSTRSATSRWPRRATRLPAPPDRSSS